MKCKNIHTGLFNLESGPCGPGETAEFSYKEAKFLIGMGRAEQVDEIPKAPPAPPAPEVKKASIKKPSK